MMRLAQARTEVPRAEMQAASPAAAFADTDPPLWEGLGAVAYKITTANDQAQTYFNQGLRLTHAFNHGEAQRAFRKAQKLDPDCAMCFWGEALVLGPNINLPMQDDAVAPAFAAAEKARVPRTRRPTGRRSMRPMRRPWRGSRPSSPTTMRSRCSTPNR
jgi:tetratricopeptide (TPR) repeat protein